MSIDLMKKNENQKINHKNLVSYPISRITVTKFRDTQKSETIAFPNF